VHSLPPTFLHTQDRPAKPRRSGVTHALDKGCALETTQALMRSIGEFLDVWKFGWGTAYIDPAVEPKVAELSRNDVMACTGGTLLEIAWLEGRTEEFFDYAAGVGFACVEVSNGATHMPADHKHELIARARERGFEVMAEVGSKDPADPVAPRQWVAEVAADIEAGASWVLAEGRESGTVGLYERDGSVREELVAALQGLPNPTPVIFEAPQRAQQAFFLRHIGPTANLGNIALDDVMSVEALRRGLRADTMGLARTWERAGVAWAPTCS
jgi:phosphosulfolactate synthase